MLGIQEQPLRDFYAYWTRRRQARSIPRRQDIDPVDIPRLLSNVMLLEVHRGQDSKHRFKFRLAGTAVCGVAGRDLTGQWLDELSYPGGYVSYLVNLNREVVELGRPTYSRTVLTFDDGSDQRTTARVICPLGENAQEVGMIVACQVFDDRPLWTPMVEENDYDYHETLRQVLD